MKIGCTYERLNAFNLWLGEQCDAVRVYCGTDAAGTGAWVTCRNLALQGYQVLASWNVGTTDSAMNAVAAGGSDAAVTAIANYMKQINIDAAGAGGEIWFCLNHEVENTSGLSSAAWRPAASRVYGLIHTLAPTVTTYYAYLGGYYRNQFEGRGPANWWPTPNSPMVLGTDYYNWRGATPAGSGNQPNHWAQNNNIRPPADLEQPPGVSLGTDAQASSQSPAGSGVNSWMELATYFGVPLCFPEFGCSITQPGTTTLPGSSTPWVEPGVPGRRNWLQSCVDAWADDPRILTLTYFEWDSGGYTDQLTGQQVNSAARVNWRLSGGLIPPDPATATVFKALRGSGPPPPPPPTDFVPGVISPMTRVKLAS